jgi:hypothetical protein
MKARRRNKQKMLSRGNAASLQARTRPQNAAPVNFCEIRLQVTHDLRPALVGKRWRLDGADTDLFTFQHAPSE